MIDNNLPREIYLEEQDYDLAKQLSEIEGTEGQKWQSYINLLGMLALERCFKESIDNLAIQRILDNIDTHAYLELKGIKVCVITQEDFWQEGLIIPKQLIDNSDHTAHFYVAIEVDEENAIAIFRGFIPYNKLSQLSLPTFEKNNYWLSVDYLELTDNLNNLFN